MAKQERKTGLQLYTLPIISEPLAEFVYNEFAEDPRSFLITTATHMDASNLDFLDHILQKSFGLISAGQLHEVGLYAFIGASFAYRFFDQHASDHKREVVKIPKNAIEIWESEERILRADFRGTKSEAARKKIYAAFRQRGLEVLTRMKRHNRFFSLGTSTFCQEMINAGISQDQSTVLHHGIAMTHELFDRASREYSAEQKQVVSHPDKEAAPNQPPMVSATIARLGLVRILLDPDKFTKDTLYEMRRGNSPLEQYVLRLANRHPETAELQTLLASYTYHCFDKQYQKLGRKFPPISEDTIQGLQIGMVADNVDALHDPDELSRRILEPSFDELRLGNQEFHARVMTELLQTYVKTGEGVKFGAVLGGVQTVYMPLREQLAINLKGVN